MSNLDLELYQSRIMQPVGAQQEAENQTPLLFEILQSRGGLESLKQEKSKGNEFSRKLSDQDIIRRVEEARIEIHKQIDEKHEKSTTELNNTELHAKVDEILEKAPQTLRAVRESDGEWLAQEKRSSLILEAIIRTDGTRPSFLVDNDKINTRSGNDKLWSNILDKSKNNLALAIAAVGRIDIAGSHSGTGFLIAKNLIVTNRHVLEGISDLGVQGKRELFSNCTISFGFESDGAPGTIRGLKQAVFYGSYNFNGIVNHNFLDLALIELEVSEENHIAPMPIFLDNKWPNPGQIIYSVGYPAAPTGISTKVEIDTFLDPRYGLKRVAPGRVVPAQTGKNWSIWHDATTLPGNSGSVILAQNNENKAAGLHYGGLSSTNANYGHILDKDETLTTQNAHSNDTLQDIMDSFEVVIS